MNGKERVCPEGQIGPVGKCQFPDSNSNTAYRMIIDFTTDADISSLEPQKLSENVILYDGVLSHWTTLLLKIIDWQTRKPIRLGAILMEPNKRFNLKKTIAILRTVLSHEWTLKTKTRDFRLKPTISKYIRYVVSSVKTDDDFIALVPIHLSYISDENDVQEVAIGNAVAYRQMAQSGYNTALSLTRAYFCYQAELLEEDFIDISVEEILLTASNISLKYGEFVRARNVLGYDTVRVCEDLLKKPGNISNLLVLDTQLYALCLICLTYSWVGKMVRMYI